MTSKPPRHDTERMRPNFGDWDSAIRAAIQKGPLNETSQGGIERLLQTATLASLVAGTVVYRPYEPGRVAIVLSGLVRAFLTSRDGRQMTIKYAVPGELFGLPVVIGGPVPASAQAVQDSRALFFDPETFESVIRSESETCWRLAEDVGAEFCDLMIQMGESLFDPIPVRTARHLMYLAVPSPRAKAVWVTKTQTEIANAVGTVREVISRTLKRFEAEGLVEVRPKHIVLKDLVRLKGLVRSDSTVV